MHCVSLFSFLIIQRTKNLPPKPVNFFQSFLIEKSAELSYALLNLKLEIVNALGFAFHFARPPNPSPAKRDEDRIPFELFQKTPPIEIVNLKFMDIFPPQKIKITEIAGKGLSVVATEKIKAGEIIEICPIIFLSDKDANYIKDTSDFLKFYYLEQAPINKSCLMLGYGSLYNHSKNPNADVDYNIKTLNRYLIFEAIKDIQTGEEIVYNYNDYDERVDFLNPEQLKF
ncbi:MAG: Nuclear protein SET [Candidatus Yanofskybacteria bacterium GW2011_GWC2_41_9]|uniref:Nuclear protein SET n=3 Tax=Candidatus Yanofskyibacteriota TaxID=1752733 RepID=A0A0G0ZUU6_9BACT|nr:MAG: Nuclear protein SET [Candidatus Yanofskybacteria bacterium GW2011_GWC2_41_9]